MSSDKQQWLIFELTSDFRAAVKLDQVVEIVPALTLSPLPNSGKYIDGLADIRGSVIPVLNMRAVFELEDHPMVHSDHLIIVRTSHDQLCILRADRTIELAQLESGTGSGSSNSLITVPFIDDVIKHNGHLIMLHNPESLKTLLSRKSVPMETFAAAGRA